MLDINRQLNSDGSLYLYNDEKVINWRPTDTSAGLPLVINATNALVIDSQVSRLAAAVKGRLDIGGASIEGTFHITEASTTVDGQVLPAWALLANQASVALQANGASARIENVTGHLLIAANGVSGTLSGDGSVTGIDGVSASGSLVASFSDNRLQLAGSAVVELQQLASRLSTLPVLGSYRMQLSSPAGSDAAPHLTMTTVDGALRVSGSGEWLATGLRFRGEASAAPGSETALSNLLNIIGRRQGARSLIAIG